MVFKIQRLAFKPLAKGEKMEGVQSPKYIAIDVQDCIQLEESKEREAELKSKVRFLMACFIGMFLLTSTVLIIRIAYAHYSLESMDHGITEVTVSPADEELVFFIANSSLKFHSPRLQTPSQKIWYFPYTEWKLV